MHHGQNMGSKKHVNEANKRKFCENRGKCKKFRERGEMYTSCENKGKL